MNEIFEQFFQAVKDNDTAILATAGAEGVTMRLVSPVYHQEQVLIFTCPRSQKYQQLQADPRCCLAVGGFFAQCQAEFCGPTMAESNDALRAAYAGKFVDAFDDGVAFGGRDADFILLKPHRLTGWTTPATAPPLPFDITAE